MKSHPRVSILTDEMASSCRTFKGTAPSALWLNTAEKAPTQSANCLAVPPSPNSDVVDCGALVAHEEKQELSVQLDEDTLWNCLAAHVSSL